MVASLIQKKMSLKGRRALAVFPVLFLLLLGGFLVGTTNTFYISSGTVANLLITGNSEVYLAEYFSPEDRWLPGETKAKIVSFGNQSDTDQVVRFKVVVEWYDNNGTPDDLTDDTPWTWSGSYNPAPAVINWTSAITGSPPAWTKIGDYYYYNSVLAAQSGQTPTETPAVISSVTFSPALSNDAAYTDDFSNKECRITILMETLNVNAADTQATWNATFVQTGSSLAWSAV